MTAGRRIRTLIVDDEPLARRKIRRRLAHDPEVDVVAVAHHGHVEPDAVGDHGHRVVALELRARPL